MGTIGVGDARGTPAAISGAAVSAGGTNALVADGRGLLYCPELYRREDERCDSRSVCRGRLPEWRWSWGLFGLQSGSPVEAATTPTFSKDVAPIIYDEMRRMPSLERAWRPMSLTTYEDARPWARAVKQKVASREMPPWGADPTIGKWAERSEPDAEGARDDRRVGGWRRARRQQGRSAEAAAVRRGLDDWQAGSRLQDDRSRSRCRPTASCRTPTSRSRRTSRKTSGFAASSCGRPIAASSTTSSATWSKATASRSISRRSLTRDRSLQGDPERPRRWTRARPPLRSLRRRRRPADPSRLGHRAADALHDDWAAGHRSDRGRRRAGQGAAVATARMFGGGQMPNVTFAIPPGDPQLRGRRQRR